MKNSITDLQNEILKSLELGGKNGLTRPEIITFIYGIKLTKSGCISKSTTIYDNLKKLHDRGMVNRKAISTDWGRPPIKWYITEKGLRGI